MNEDIPAKQGEVISQPAAALSKKKNSNKKLLYIILGGIGCVGILCAVAVVAIFGLSALGINKAQDSLKDTQVRAFMRDVEADLRQYYQEYYQYPRKLEDMNITATFSYDEDFVVDGNELEVAGYTILYERHDETSYTLMTDLSNGEEYVLSTEPSSS